MRHESAERDAAMADRVLLFGAHLRSRDLEALGDEDRVVAEATLAAGGASQGASHLASLDELAPIRGDQDGSLHEGGTAVSVRNIGELIDE